MTTKLEIISTDICSNLLLCRKTVKLYPQEHPRVREVIERVSAGVEEYARERGRAFTLQTSERAQGTEERTESAVDRDQREILRILKLNLVETLSIPAGASQDEIYELCTLLEEEFTGGDEEESGDPFLECAARWKSVRVTFYEPQEASNSSDSVQLLRRKAGIHQIRSLEPAFARLSEEDARKLRDEVSSPQFLLKISELRDALRVRDAKAEAESGGGEGIDLLGEFVAASMPGDPDEKVDGERLLEGLNKFVEFLGSNVEALSAAIHSYPGDESGDALKEHLRKAFQSELDVSDRGGVGAFQQQKERLSFLFRTTSEIAVEVEDDDCLELPPPTAEERRPAAPAKEGERSREASAKPTGPTLDALFADIDCSVDRIAADLGPFDFERFSLSTALEMLLIEEYREPVQRALPTLISALESCFLEEEFVDWAVREIGAYAGSVRNEVLADVLVRSLRQIDDNELSARALNDLMQDERKGLAIQCLNQFIRKISGRTVSLLCTVRKHGNRHLSEIARMTLISLGRSPLHLAEWATNDPSSLLVPDVLRRVLRRISSEGATEAFRTYFTSMPPQQAEWLIERLPERVPGAEVILFAAIDYGSPKTRWKAIEKLGRYPSSVTIGTLQAMLKRNNTRERFQAKEVEAVVSALARIDDASVRRFFDDVLTRKNVFSHVYLREIRKVVAAAVEKESTT